MQVKNDTGIVPARIVFTRCFHFVEPNNGLRQADERRVDRL